MMTKHEARIAKVFWTLLGVGLFGLVILHDKVERDCSRDHPEITFEGAWEALGNSCSSQVKRATEGRI